MTPEKFVLKSKTIIGALLTFLIVILPQFGINFTADDSALIARGVDEALAFLTTSLTVYGRFTADSQVKL